MMMMMIVHFVIYNIYIKTKNWGNDRNNFYHFWFEASQDVARSEVK